MNTGYVDTKAVRPTVDDLKPWDRQPGETAKAYAAFLVYRDLPALDRSVAAAWGRKKGGKYWERWCTDHNWLERAAKHDSDLASRRRERMAQELDLAQDDAMVTIRAALDKVKERIEGMDAEELAAGQIPTALRTLIKLELKVLGEDRVALTGKGGGPVKTEITGKDGGPVKTQHVFQPSKEVWDDILQIRAEFERLRDGDTDEETVSDSL